MGEKPFVSKFLTISDRGFALGEAYHRQITEGETTTLDNKIKYTIVFFINISH